MNNHIKDLMLKAGYAAPEIATRAQELVRLVQADCKNAMIKAIWFNTPEPNWVAMRPIIKTFEDYLDA